MAAIRSTGDISRRYLIAFSVALAMSLLVSFTVPAVFQTQSPRAQNETYPYGFPLTNIEDRSVCSASGCIILQGLVQPVGAIVDLAFWLIVILALELGLVKLLKL